MSAPAFGGIAMRRSNLIKMFVAAAFLLATVIVTSAQTGQLRGSVQLAGADGKQTPVAGATVDVYRTDMKSEYHTKSDKKGEWVFAGLPFVGRYIVAISAPGASPSARADVRAGQDISVDMVLSPGDGKKLTEAEATAAAKGAAPATNGGGGGDSAAEKANAEAMAKK